MSEELNFKFQEPRSIPVILLLDTSGSMAGNGNIDVLNASVKEMLDDFAKQYDNNVAIQVAIYTFGPDAKQFLPLMHASDAKQMYKPMEADGGTPLGGALSLAKEGLIENKDMISSRCYRPTVILVSDGMPNDNWQPALEAFCSGGRSSKCYRMAMGIGVPKDTTAHKVLETFTGDPKLVFTAEEATTIRKFFKYVTFSTIQRSTSATPNVIQQKSFEELVDDDDFNF